RSRPRRWRGRGRRSRGSPRCPPPGRSTDSAGWPGSPPRTRASGSRASWFPSGCSWLGGLLQCNRSFARIIPVLPSTLAERTQAQHLDLVAEDPIVHGPSGLLLEAGVDGDREVVDPAAAQAADVV